MARDYQERKGNTEGVLRGLVIKWSVSEKTATGQKLQRAAGQRVSLSNTKGPRMQRVDSIVCHTQRAHSQVVIIIRLSLGD